MVLSQQPESTAALMHVTDQIADWHTWMIQEEPPHQPKRFKAEPASATQAAVKPEPEPKQPPAPAHRPARAGARSGMGEIKTNGKPVAPQTRQHQDHQHHRLAGHKRQHTPKLDHKPPQHPTAEPRRPDHHFSRPRRAYVEPTNQGYPLLAQKTKAKPGIPPWRPARAVQTASASSQRPRHPRAAPSSREHSPQPVPWAGRLRMHRYTATTRGH